MSEKKCIELVSERDGIVTPASSSGRPSYWVLFRIDECEIP